MNKVRRYISLIYSIYAFIVFLLVMLLLLPGAVVAFFMGPIRGGNLIYDLCRLWADICFFFWGFKHRNLFEGDYNPNHPVVIVFNHISFMDIPVLMKTFRKRHVRILGKAEMAKVPLFGFIYKQAVVMVDRSSAEARATSMRKMKEILENNISVVIAPEGTFNTTDNPLKTFYNGAFKLAIEMQVPILPVLILDTYNRMHYKSVFSLKPGITRSVFLQEISVKQFKLNDSEALKEKVYHVMEEGLIRYKAPWIK